MCHNDRRHFPPMENLFTADSLFSRMSQAAGRGAVTKQTPSVPDPQCPCLTQPRSGMNGHGILVMVVVWLYVVEDCHAAWPGMVWLWHGSSSLWNRSMLVICAATQHCMFYGFTYHIATGSQLPQPCQWSRHVFNSWEPSILIWSGKLIFFDCSIT